MKKYHKFLLIGTAAVVTALAAFSTTIGQGVWYDNLITNPTEKVQSYFGKEDKIKLKHQKFLKEDQKFLASLNLPKEILDTKVILKYHTGIDKIFYPFMKLGYVVFQIDEEKQAISQSKYEGNFSAYYSFKQNNKNIEEYVMLGVNGIEEKNPGIYKDLHQIFKNEQQLSSFVFFHEISHKIGKTLGNEDQKLKEIIQIFEKNKGVKLSDSDKNIIASQYSETFADSLAISMLIKKYPELDFEKTKKLIAGVRMHNSESTHLSSPGVVNMDNPKNLQDIQSLISSAQKSALVTTQFYSHIDFSLVSTNIQQEQGREIPVNFLSMDSDSVKNNILEARKSFIEISKSNTLNNKI